MSRGRTREFEGVRFNFVLPDALKKEMDKVILLGRRLGRKITYADIIRKGILRQITTYKYGLKKTKGSKYED